jgi:hypothetical protein
MFLLLLKLIHKETLMFLLLLNHFPHRMYIVLLLLLSQYLY